MDSESLLLAEETDAANWIAKTTAATCRDPLEAANRIAGEEGVAYAEPILVHRSFKFEGARDEGLFPRQ